MSELVLPTVGRVQKTPNPFLQPVPASLWGGHRGHPGSEEAAHTPLPSKTGTRIQTRAQDDPTPARPERSRTDYVLDRESIFTDLIHDRERIATLIEIFPFAKVSGVSCKYSCVDSSSC